MLRYVVLLVAGLAVQSVVGCGSASSTQTNGVDKKKQTPGGISAAQQSQVLTPEAKHRDDQSTPLMEAAPTSESSPLSSIGRRRQRESFVLLSFSGDVSFDPSLLPLSPPGASRGGRGQGCFFLRQELGATDKVCLAVFAVRGALSVFTLQLCQFDEILFEGDPDIHHLASGMLVLELRLRRKTYLSLDALVRGLANDEPEAIDFRDRHRLPSLETLKCCVPDSSAPSLGYDPALDNQRFLYVGKCNYVVK